MCRKKDVSLPLLESRRDGMFAAAYMMKSAWNIPSLRDSRGIAGVSLFLHTSRSYGAKSISTDNSLIIRLSAPYLDRRNLANENAPPSAPVIDIPFGLSVSVEAVRNVKIPDAFAIAEQEDRTEL